MNHLLKSIFIFLLLGNHPIFSQCFTTKYISSNLNSRAIELDLSGDSLYKLSLKDTVFQGKFLQNENMIKLIASPEEFDTLYIVNHEYLASKNNDPMSVEFLLKTKKSDEGILQVYNTWIVDFEKSVNYRTDRKSGERKLIKTFYRKHGPSLKFNEKGEIIGIFIFDEGVLKNKFIF